MRASLGLAPEPNGNGNGSNGHAVAPVVAPYLEAVWANNVTPEKPVWIQRGYLPASVLALIIGRQGAGKTTYAAYVAAQLTTGRPLPGEAPAMPVTVAVLSLEESPDRLVARLSAAGAELSRVAILRNVVGPDGNGGKAERPWRLPYDTTLLREQIEACGAALTIVDGIGYALQSRSGEPGYAEVGSALTSLASVAASTGCTILGLTHPPKGGADPVTAAIGSTSWTAIPRITWVLGYHPDDMDVAEDMRRRVVRVGKSNYRHPSHGWSFRISEDPDLEAGWVDDLAECDVSADVVMGPLESSDQRAERTAAAEWLTDFLADGDPQPYKVIERAASEEGISRATLHRARKEAGVEIERDDSAKGRPSSWVLSHGITSHAHRGGVETKSKPPLTSTNDPGLGITSHATALRDEIPDSGGEDGPPEPGPEAASEAPGPVIRTSDGADAPVRDDHAPQDSGDLEREPFYDDSPITEDGWSPPDEPPGAFPDDEWDFERPSGVQL